MRQKQLYGKPTNHCAKKGTIDSIYSIVKRATLFCAINKWILFWQFNPRRKKEHRSKSYLLRDHWLGAKFAWTHWPNDCPTSLARLIVQRVRAIHTAAAPYRLLIMSLNCVKATENSSPECVGYKIQTKQRSESEWLMWLICKWPWCWPNDNNNNDRRWIKAPPPQNQHI